MTNLTHLLKKPVKYNLDDCFRWVVERENARMRNDDNRFQPPYSPDPIIAKYRFCNVRREDDRVTVWVRENIREQFGNHPYLWFMLCIARQINWPETLQELIDQCWPSRANFTPELMGKVLQNRAERGEKVFTGAYNITAPPTKGVKKTHFVAEHTLGNLWRARESAGFNVLAARMQAVHTKIRSYNCWGPFMAYQAVVDMRFCPLLLQNAPDITTWAAAGPGTLRGLNRVHSRPLGT